MRLGFYVVSMLLFAVVPALAEGPVSNGEVPTFEEMIPETQDTGVAENVAADIAEGLPDTAESFSASDNQPEVLSPQMPKNNAEPAQMPKENPSEADVPAEQGEEAPQETIDETLPEVQLDVFDPDFMNSLMKCQPNQETRNGRTLKIVGLNEEKCRLTYGNYELNLPKTILNNVHSFDDLHTLLKNTDFASYKYLPKYVYDGLVYALDACLNHEEYMGVEEEETLVDAIVTRGLNSEYIDDVCTIYLQNELDLDGTYFDYGVVCRLPQDVVDELEPYFKDVVAKYPQTDVMSEEQPKEVRDADIALMYYLQQNDYCQQNKRNLNK